MHRSALHGQQIKDFSNGRSDKNNQLMTIFILDKNDYAKTISDAVLQK